MTAELPQGWELEHGAGGWRAINRERNWQTIVYCDSNDKGPGQLRAIATAVQFEAKVKQTLRAQQRLCEELREYFAETM